MEGPSSSSYPLLRRHTNKRDFNTMANNFDYEPSDSLFVSEDEQYSNERTTQTARTSRLALPSRAPRFEGDGYDYRRPMMSEGGSGSGSGQNVPAVIDLTEDDEGQNGAFQTNSASTAAGSSRTQRYPRFGRDIIDISDAEDEFPSETTSTRPNIADHIPPRGHRSARDHHPRISLLRRPSRHNSNPSNMDDLEFVHSRPRSRPQSVNRSSTPLVAPAQRSVTPYPASLHDTIDLTEDNDDEVVHLDTRTRHGDNMTSPGASGGIGTQSTADRGAGFDFAANFLQAGSRLLQRIGNFEANLPAYGRGNQQQGHRRHEPNHGGAAGAHRPRHQIDPHSRYLPPPVGGFSMAIAMDYDITGFDLGIIGGNRPPTPKYEPPEPAAPGFTRSPEEDEVVVCPNCGDELAMGTTEEKQQIWVIKTCGHVYCGDCAQHRTRSSQKGKGKVVANGAPQPFKYCVVDGCKESASAKSMVKVYFGG